MNATSFFDQPTVSSKVVLNAMFSTLNTVYYVSRGRCVAVKSLATNRFIERHNILGARLVGFVFARSAQGPLMPLPYPMRGCRLWFSTRDQNVLSSRVSAIQSLR